MAFGIVSRGLEALKPLASGFEGFGEYDYATKKGQVVENLLIW